MKFRELVEQTLENKKMRAAASTCRVDSRRVQEAIARFGELPAPDVTTTVIEDFLAGVWKRTAGPTGNGATANRHRSLLSSVFSFGVKRALVASNPVAAIPEFPENEGRVRFLDIEEERSLAAALDDHHRAQVELALHTGIRKGEQNGLTWEKVDLNARILTVRGKTGRRFVPINSGARSAIERLHRASGGSQFVCPREWRRWFPKACKAAGIHDFRWHDLRHTFASRLVMKGVDLSSVQRLLGHSSIVQTMRYAHLSPEHLRAAVDRLDEKENPQLLLFATRS